jgi:hypothetical protein
MTTKLFQKDKESKTNYLHISFKIVFHTKHDLPPEGHSPPTQGGVPLTLRTSALNQPVSSVCVCVCVSLSLGTETNKWKGNGRKEEYGKKDKRRVR